MRSSDEVLADMNALLDGAAGRDLTDDEINQWNTLDAELAASTLAEARARATGGSGGEGDSGSGTTGGDGATPPAPAPADRAGQAARTRASQQIRTQHAAFNTVVVPAGRPRNSQGPRDTIDRAFTHYLRTGRENADLEELRAPQNAQSTGTGSAGGFLVPETFLNRIVEVVKSFAGVFNDAEQLQTDSGNPLRFPKNDDTSNTATVAVENAAPASGADITFDDVELSAFEYAASGTGGNALSLSIALVQDSAIDIDAFVARILGRRLGRKMANDAVLGNGTGQAQGILQGVAGTAAAATLLYSDLVSLAMSIDPYYWTGAKWYMNAASLGTVMELEDGAGQLIFKPGFAMIGDASAAHISGAIQVGGILAPIVVETAFPTFAASGSVKWAAFGNMNEAYIWRQVRQIEVLVDPYSAANKRQINYNAFVRADGRQKDTAAYAVSKTAA